MAVSVKFSVLAALCAAVSACTANDNTAYRISELGPAPTVITVDAKQRSILSAYRLLKPDGKPDEHSVRAFCSEPSPDVFSVLAQSLSAGGSFGKSANPASIQAAFNLAFSSAEQGSTIPRTQTINMLRELMFRTCERYLNGGYDPTELSLQAIRDQRLMVSILGIEQLTGVVTPKPVVIAATGSGGAGASGEAIVRLDDARKAKDEADGALEAATAKYEQTNGTDKVCDAIDGKKEADLTDDQKAKLKPCSDDKAAKDKAVAKSVTATAAYQELSTLARSGGVSVATAVSSTAQGGLDQANVASIQSVAATVKDIVTLNFSDTTETMMFCLRILREIPDAENGEKALALSKEQRTDLKSVCVSYLDTGVRAAEARLAGEIAKSTDGRKDTSNTNFVTFWTDARKAQFQTVAGRQAFADLLYNNRVVARKELGNCFVAATDEAGYRACFQSLPMSAQVIATKM